MVRVVDVLRQIAPVDILYIPANHDMTSSFQLSQYLKAWYKADKNVRIDDSPLPRKYYKYGDTLLVFAHDGDVKRLPGLIADEARDKWSRVKFTDGFSSSISILKRYCWRKITCESRGYLPYRLRAHGRWIKDTMPQGNTSHLSMMCKVCGR